jgi:hypothetical protein
MYDMYPWDSASQGEYPPQPLRSCRKPAKAAKPAKPATADISPAQAVQVALDRRDNGGDATQPVASPAASRARQ